MEKTCRHSFYNKQCVAQEEHRALLAKVLPTSNANSKMTTTQVMLKTVKLPDT